MKKILVILILFMLILTGCGKEKYFECKIDLENKIDNYQQNSVYKIYYNKKNYVTKIEKEDIYKSSKDSIISYFEEYKTLDYTNLNDLYGGYEFEIESNNSNEIKVKAIIDLKKVDTKKMVDDGYLDEDYVVGSNLTTGGIKYYYTKKGASC